MHNFNFKSARKKCTRTNCTYWLLRPTSEHCLCERVWPGPSFSIILCITAVEFSIQRMCVKYAWLPPDLYFTHISSCWNPPQPKCDQKMWKKSNSWVVSYPHLSPQESWWKTNLVIVRSRGTGASPVLSHCKSRKCSKLSRFLLDWSQPEPLIRVDQFINISRESLKISTSGVCVNIFSIQCKVVPNSRLIPDFTCHGRRMEDGWMSTMGSKTLMHLSVEQEAALETGGAQLLILILNNCKIK